MRVQHGPTTSDSRSDLRNMGTQGCGLSILEPFLAFQTSKRILESVSQLGECQSGQRKHHEIPMHWSADFAVLVSLPSKRLAYGKLHHPGSTIVSSGSGAIWGRSEPSGTVDSWSSFCSFRTGVHCCNFPFIHCPQPVLEKPHLAGDQYLDQPGRETGETFGPR